MYIQSDYRDVEPICYEEPHIANVTKVIESNFEPYFGRYLNSKGGEMFSDDEFESLARKFGASSVKRDKKNNPDDVYREIIEQAISDYSKDRESYQKIFDAELLEDYKEDTAMFKSVVLRNECPIIRKTLANKKAKELDGYRQDFNRANAKELLAVVTNLNKFCRSYVEDYQEEKYEQSSNYKDLGLMDLSGEGYTYFGVIGAGIKSHMLYKVAPALFPNRSRNALWAMWYLTNKETFGCETSSEFLMIDVTKDYFQQNYFYPYGLFAWYAFTLYKMLKNKVLQYGVNLDPEYRYVYVNSFLEYVAFEHRDAIDELKRKIKDGGRGYE